MKTNKISNTMKNLYRWLLFITLILAGLIVAAVLITSPVAAQCNTTKSSCVSCHGSGIHVAGMGEWNRVHEDQDICTYCHGGNASSTDKALAHEGLVAQPLSDIYASCHSCHPSDYVAKSSQFAATLKVTPDGCATPTAVAARSVPGGTFPQGIVPATTTKSVISSGIDFLAISMGIVVLAFIVFAIGWLEKHPKLVH
jgi:hypothetical protein